MLLRGSHFPVICIPRHGPAAVRLRLKSATQISCFCSSQDNASHSESSKLKPWLLVGLGNPGKKYEGTRHNVGFEMIDHIARAEGISLNAIQSKALIGKGYIGDTPILLAKPQTYMMLSGESVGPLRLYYQIPFYNTLLFAHQIFDTVDLPCGSVSLQPKGGHRGHKGVSHVIEKFEGRKSFPRLYIGIGQRPETMDNRAYVLQRFTSSDQEKVNSSFEHGLEGIRMLLAEGFSRKLELFNRRQRYQHMRV